LAAIGAGAAGGFVGGGVNTALNEKIETGSINEGDVAEGALLGALTGAAAVGVGPEVQGGQNFDPLTSPNTFGPRANQLYGQTAIGGVLGAVPDIAKEKNLNGRKDACP
jgi:hypothetical protein